MAAPKTVIVTGANRGIGQAICRLILSDHANSTGGLRLLATSRKGDSLGFQGGGNSVQILYPKLDISSESSIRDFTEYIRSDIKSVNVLINNAGINVESGQMSHIPSGRDGASDRLELAKKTLEVNYHGTKNLTLALLPFMKPHNDQQPRVVSLSSVASGLSLYADAIRDRFRNPENTIKDVDKITTDFLEAVANSREKDAGFSEPGRAYGVSKAALNSLAAILAREHEDVLINTCCPGWIDTDMGGLVGSQKVRPPKTVEEGARIPLNLAFGDIGSVTGKYWANSTIRSKDIGQVQEP